MEPASAQKRRIVIIFAGRFPSEKAAAIFVDLNARSLVSADADVTVLAPRRLGRGELPQAPYTVRYLPTLDLSRIPVIWGIANFVSVYVFAKFVLLWLLFHGSDEDVVISNDAWPLLVATLLRKNTVYEMHDFAKSSFLYRSLFRRVRYILVTNEWKRGELKKVFGVPDAKILLERNAVDVEQFGRMSRDEARGALDLGLDEKIVVYTGHLYEWKGAETLAKAATLVPDARFVFVGGTAADVASFSTKWSGAGNIRVVGHVPHDRIPLWQAAADVLVLPNSGKEEISVHYTSPMKLFEYLASERPIVASDLPSIREILPDAIGYFATADDPQSFAYAIKTALADSQASERAHSGRTLVEQYSWQKRAERILQRIL